MNIWLLQTGEPLPLNENTRKMRTALLAERLAARGHSVTWWASAFDHFNKDWIFKKDSTVPIHERIKIIALKGFGYRKNVSFSRVIDHRIIARKFKKTAPKMPRPDILIVSMPPYDLAYEAVRFAKASNIPVCVDIRDPWPDIFLNHVPAGLRNLVNLLLFRDFHMVRETVKMGDGLIAVTNTFLEWGLNYANREQTWKDRVFYLGAKKNSDSNLNQSKLSKLDRLGNKFIVAFLGTFESYHNPSILLECAKKLNNDQIYFVLGGNGRLFSEIEEKACDLHNVILLDWLNQDEISALLSRSHVGVCPTPYVTGLFPNKAFSYLSASLPIVSAFEGEIRDIIKTHQIGCCYPPNDADALYACIRGLFEDPDHYNKVSENAGKVFNDMFDADKIYEDYADHIERISNDKGP